MTKASSTSSSTGSTHDANDSKADNKSTGSSGSTASTAASGAGTALEKVGGAATFETLIAELKAVSLQAMVQDIRLRSLSTELSSERKVASERVNG